MLVAGIVASLGTEDIVSVEEVSVMAEEAGSEAAMAEHCLLVIHKLCGGLHVGIEAVMTELCLLVINILCEGGEIS